MGIAVFLAECVGLSVLASKMENVNCEADIFEDWVIEQRYPQHQVGLARKQRAQLILP